MPRPKAQQGSLKEGMPKLQRRQAWSLDHKIDYANRMIARVLKRHKHPIVCWSGGKDSTVILHLVLKHRPNIDVVFNDTGVEFPETRDFVSQIVKDWKVNLHTAKPKPGETFWDVTAKHGWPIFGKEQSDNIERGQGRLANAKPDKDGIPNAVLLDSLDEIGGFEKMSDMERALVAYNVDVSTRCCDFLKERPTKALELELQIDCKILGIMASESYRRTLVWIDHGDYYYTKHYFGRNKGLWKAQPMSLWTEDNIWEYHERFEIPHCTIYDLGHERNGCWTCAMGVKFGQLKRLRQSHPKLFHYLMVRREMGRELVKAKVALNSSTIDPDRAEQWAEEVDIDLLLAQHPCFFDKL